jgi:PLP dependent protein
MTFEFDMQARIVAVREAIAASEARASRVPGSVTLIAVSKRHPAAAIRAAYACGLRDFGENYVQELVAKAADLADLTELRWHLIGHLQTNKVKQVAKVAHVVHTLDSEKLVVELDKRARDEGRTVDAYVEVNIDDEGQKSGCAVPEVANLVRRVRACGNVHLRGLMTVGARVEGAEAARSAFARLRRLRDEFANGTELSMGMSADFAVAIEEGASVVRIGTAIFGTRT